jgi:hypothetical protein
MAAGFERRIGAGASFYETGDDSVVWSAIAALPPSIANDSDVFAWRLCFALIDREWAQAKELIDKMKGSENNEFASLAKITVFPLR